jgi:hypothetical protein
VWSAARLRFTCGSGCQVDACDRWRCCLRKPEDMTARLQQVDVVVAQGQGIADATRQPPATAISGASRRRAPRGRSCSRSTRISRSSSASAFFPTKTRAISRASPTAWPRRDCRRAVHPSSGRGITFRMRSKKNHGGLLSSRRSSDRKRSRPNRAFSATPHDGQRPSTIAEDPGTTQPRAGISAAAAQTRMVSVAKKSAAIRGICASFQKDSL